MSRELPKRPRLEYLRKQAKELLRTMPQGKLADAQHTLANEYGFATWAKLKSHVVTLGVSDHLNSYFFKGAPDGFLAH